MLKQSLTSCEYHSRFSASLFYHYKKSIGQRWCISCHWHHRWERNFWNNMLPFLGYFWKMKCYFYRAIIIGIVQHCQPKRFSWKCVFLSSYIFQVALPLIMTLSLAVYIIFLSKHVMIIYTEQIKSLHHHMG